MRSRLTRKDEWRKNPGFADSDFMFCREDGSLIEPHNLSNNFRKILEKNNRLSKEGKRGYMALPKIRLYDLRHSMATNMIMGKAIPDKVVGEIMGNSVKTLLHHYSHARAGMHKEALANYAEGIL